MAPMEEEPDFVLTWGFFGGKKPRKDKAVKAVAAPAPIPTKKPPSKVAKDVLETKVAIRGRRALPAMLPGLASSIRGFSAPGATVPASDGLAEHYSEMAATEENPRVREAAMLFAVAESSIEECGDPSQALQAASGALTLFQELGNEAAEADALRLMVHAQRMKAAALRDSGDEVGMQKAERTVTNFVQRNLATFKASGKKRSLAAMLVSAAEVSFERRSGMYETRNADIKEAMELLKEAQAIFKEIKDQRGEAIALVVICIGLLQQEPSRARRAAEAAQAKYKALDDKKGEAKALHVLAQACFRGGSIKEALDAARGAKTLYQALEEDMGMVLTLYTIAQQMIAARRPAEAAAPAEQALAVVKELDNDKGWKGALEALIVEAHVTAGEVTAGVARAEAALASYTAAAVATDRAFALDMAARAELAAGNVEKALAHAEAGLQVCREKGADRAWEAGMLHLVAHIQSKKEDFGKAAVMAGGAWRLFGRLGDDTNQAMALLTEAQANIDAGDYFDAGESAKDAMVLAHELGNKAIEATALSTAAKAHLLRDEGEEAMSLAKEGLVLFQDAVDGKGGEATALRLVAQVNMLNGDIDQAADPARKALQLSREVADAKAELESLRILANLQISRKSYEEAVRAADDAFALGKQLGWNTKDEAEANLLLCQALFARMCHDGEVAKDAWTVISRSESKVVRHAEEAVKLAKKVEDKTLNAYAVYTFASVTRYVYISLGKTEKLNGVLGIAQEAGNLFSKIGDVSGEGNAAFVEAEVHMACGQFNEAQDKANKASELARSCGDQELLARTSMLFYQQAGQQVAMPQVALPVVEAKAEEPEWTEEAASVAVKPSKPKGLDPNYVSNLVKNVALEAVGDAETIEMDVPLMESGLDSLGAITFRNKLQQETGLKLGGTLMFDYPTMAGVRDHIVELSLAD